MRKFLASGCVALSVLCTGPANARFETLDSRFGTDTLIVDSVTGVQYLRLDQTRGLSYDDVYNQLGTTFAGFRFAGGEIDDLVHSIGLNSGNGSSAGAYGPWPQSLLDATHEFVTAFGALGSDTTGLTLTGFTYAGLATLYGDDGSPLGVSFVEPMSVRWTPTQANYIDDAVFFYKPVAYAHIGSYLVATAPIPEPSTYLLMLGGLGLLVAVSRRRSSAPT